MLSVRELEDLEENWFKWRQYINTKFVWIEYVTYTDTLRRSHMKSELEDLRMKSELEDLEKNWFKWRQYINTKFM